MIHLFPIFSRDAADTPFGAALRELGVEHRILAGSVRLNHRSRAGLLLVGLPRLAGFALWAGVRSLLLLAPHPRAVVLGSDVEVLVFSALALLARPFRRPPRIVLLGFILTGRKGVLHDRLHRAYYRFVLGRTDLVICHSRLEVARYATLFAGARTRFVHLPWGTHVTGLPGEALVRQPRLVAAAGRSGRDYATLLRAAVGLDCELAIVCDGLEALPGEVGPGEAGPGEAAGRTPHLRVLRHCHGDDYFRVLLQAAVVVVPLLVDDISAGQMVMIQAMACGCALVVTDTPTTREYVSHDVEALLVPLGDAAAMAAALRALLADAGLRERLGRAASAAFRARFSMQAYVRGLVQAVLADAGPA